MRARVNREITRRQILALAGGLAGTGVLAACGATPAPAATAATATTAPVAEATTAPVAEATVAPTAVPPTAAPPEKLTIRWMGDPWTSAAGVADSPVELLLEERFNVNLEPVFVARDQFPEKQKLMLTSGDIPDLIMVYDSVDVRTFASQGLLAEVPFDVVQAQMPRYYDMLAEVTPDIWFFSQFEGRNMGIRRLYIDGAYSAGCGWRTDWLEKVGLAKVPETIEEFEEAFRRFVDQDPEGNGQKDTYGLSGGKDTLGVYLYAEIFGAFGVIPGQWALKNGQVVRGAVQPAAKDALELLSRWYQEGLVDAEFATRDDFNGRKMFNAEKIGYMSERWYYGWEPFPNSWAWRVKQINPDAQVGLGPLPKGIGGQGSYRWGPYNNFIVFGKQVDQEPDKLAKMLEMLEVVTMDWDLAVRVNWGEQGVHWDYVDPAVGEDSGMKILPPYDNYEERAKEGLSEQPFRDPFWATGLIDVKFRPRPFGAEFAQLLDQYGKTPPFPNETYDDVIRWSSLPSSAQVGADLDALWPQVYAEIISGKRPVDSFDDFVGEFAQRGGDQLEQEANEFYAEMTAYKAP